MTEARLIRPISCHGMDHISAIWCFWRSRMSSMSWNQVPFIPSGIIFVSLFEWSSDILRKMDFSSVWQLYKAVLVLVLIDTSSAFKVKIENLSWNWDFWSFWSFFVGKCGSKWLKRMYELDTFWSCGKYFWPNGAHLCSELLIEPYFRSGPPWSYIPACRVQRYSRVFLNFRNLDICNLKMTNSQLSIESQRRRTSIEHGDKGSAVRGLTATKGHHNVMLKNNIIIYF